MNTNVNVDPNMLSPPFDRASSMSEAGLSMPISSFNPVSPMTLWSAASPNKNATSPDQAVQSVFYSYPIAMASQETSKTLFTQQMEECVDKVQNMEIACSANTHSSAQQKSHSSAQQKSSLDYLEHPDLECLMPPPFYEAHHLDALVENLDRTDDPFDLYFGSPGSLFEPNEDDIMDYIFSID